MKIGIIGTRGIPNNYGGFEQFAEHLSKGLLELGHEVYVYSIHDHVYKENEWFGVKLIHKYNSEKYTGTWGQFVYDFLCILDCRKRHFDIILQLGYTSSSVWGWLLPHDALIATNMDGLEWKRSKYNKLVQRFLMYAEGLAVKTSDYLISDSVGIQNYLRGKYSRDSVFIPYGTDVFYHPDPGVIEKYNIASVKYNMLIARMEPENNIEIILDGVCESNSQNKFLVIGNCHANSFGKHLKKKFRDEKRIVFLGPIYNIEILNNLRYYSNLYFHGHSVGGTNPSLLEAMASNCLICAHKNPFNSFILGEDAYYFSSKEDVAQLIDQPINKQANSFLRANLTKVENLYLWGKIINDYEKSLMNFLKAKSETNGSQQRKSS